MIGNLIKQERLHQNLKQISLSKGICSVSYLSKIENNQAVPSDEVLSLLLRKLNLEWKDLSTKEEEKFIVHVANKYKVAIINRDTGKVNEFLLRLSNNAYNFNSIEYYIYFSLYVMRLYLIVGDKLNEVRSMILVLKTLQEQFDDKQKFMFNLNLGIFYFYERNYSQNVKILEDAIPFLTSLSFDGWEIADFNNVLSLAYSMNNDFSNAAQYADRSLEFYRNNLPLHRAVDNYIVLGNAHKKLKNLKKSEESYLFAMKIASDLNLVEHIAMINQNLGSLCSIQGDFNKALKFFKRSYNAKKKLNDKESLLRTIFSIIKEFSKQNNKMQVIKWCKIGLEQIDEPEEIFQKSYYFHYQIYQALSNRIGNLQSLIKLAILHFEMIEDFRYLKKYKSLLANYYYENNQYKLAATYYKQSMELYNKDISITYWEDL